MKTKLIRINERDMEKHLSMPEIESAPIYYYYEPDSGYVRIWPPDRNNTYKLNITVEN